MRADLEHGPTGILEIVDDFPDIVPVCQSELDVIETYLGSLLDDLLKHTTKTSKHLGAESDGCDNAAASAGMPK